jgi:hypothetical protein
MSTAVAEKKRENPLAVIRVELSGMTDISRSNGSSARF